MSRQASRRCPYVSRFTVWFGIPSRDTPAVVSRMLNSPK